MSAFSYENQGTNTYLVYTIQEEDSIDSMGLGMLTNNRIPGFAQTLLSQLNTTKYIKFNVTAKIPVRQFFSGPVNKKRLLGVFNGIIDGLMMAEEYMLDMGTILLDLDYIFSDVTTCETVLICLPIERQETPRDLRTFFKDIMFNTQFDQMENCDHVAKIMNYLNSTPMFTLEKFKELLNGVSREFAIRPTVKVVPSVQPKVPRKEEKPVRQQEMQTQKAVVAPPPAPAQKEVAPFAVPQKEEVACEPETVESEKKMSWMYLMQHYSKENAEIYKKQKESAKETQGSKQNKRASKKKKNTSAESVEVTKKKSPPPEHQVTFAIPGQPPVEQVPSPAIKEENKGTNMGVIAKNKPVEKIPSSDKVNSSKPHIFPPATVVSANFGQTTVLGVNGQAGETTVLMAQNVQQKPQPYLLRVKNGERILLDKPVFRIGKERSYVDYFVGDNTAVSRSHANIIIRDDTYYIVDTNSTNHTYVNGGMIISNTETILTHGDKIRLANEDFEFNMY